MSRFALLLALTTAACGGAVQSIEMKGNEPDLAAIAGTWQGKYQAVETGRSGPIEFSLELGRHTADGQVTMGGSHTALKVNFVAVKHDTISGSMEPYMEPTCSCQVQTRFEGRVTGNEIDGTFTTQVTASGNELHGTWKVERAVVADGT